MSLFLNEIEFHSLRTNIKLCTLYIYTYYIITFNSTTIIRKYIIKRNFKYAIGL